MNINLDTGFWIFLIPFVLVARMKLKILNATFCIVLISLTNAPFLFDDLRNIRINYGTLDSSNLNRMLLFGNPKFPDNVTSSIIYAIIEFIESTNRFSGPIYD